MKERIREISLYLPGAIFIMLGILVVLFPMLLVALFSASLIFIGITTISVVYRLRKWRRHPHWTMTWEPINPAAEDWLNRVFVYKRRF